jgi:hypothetical protein
MRPGEEDQLRAAVRETVTRLEARAASHPNSAESDGHPHPWVRALADWFEQEIHARRIFYCRHVHTAGPRPVHAAAWLPGIIACDLCVALGLFDLQGAADRICDRCGMDTLEVGIFTGAASLGLLTIDYGLCPGCFDDLKRAIEEAG